MNIVLFYTQELNRPLSILDRRAVHIIQVLGKKPGDQFKAGVINTSTGRAVLTSITDREITFSYEAEKELLPLFPLTLLLGFPRPIQARRIFKDLASLGVEKIILSGTELGEKSYRESNFFKHEEYWQHLIEGAEQAGSPMLPVVERHWSLAKALEILGAPSDTEKRILLHPQEATSSAQSHSVRLLDILPGAQRFVLAVGSERGWTKTELDSLAHAGFAYASLGERILKTETACIAAIAILLAQLGAL